MRQGFLTPGGLADSPTFFACNSLCDRPRVRRGINSPSHSQSRLKTDCQISFSISRLGFVPQPNLQKFDNLSGQP
jgi:hypothetical protein